MHTEAAYRNNCGAPADRPHGARHPIAGCAAALSVGLWTAASAQESVRSATLEEITVTATRHADTVNRVPLSITAVTQDHLDEQGIKTPADLTRYVPGLNSTANPGGAQQTFSIRGIVGGTGAATTSVYLDDTNLTKRSNGGVAQNNGVTVPALYDLERVEVLKGPQGTLYGGSSQGGTVRYITPTPSLDTYSGSTRAEISSVGGRGELSHEYGAAFGGPIVQDKLGFRVSGLWRESGGWIDVVSAYTGETIKEDANSAWQWAGRATLLWQMTENTNAQLSYYHVDNKSEGGPGSSTAVYLNGQPAPAGTTFTTPERCITDNTRTAPMAQEGDRPASAFIPRSTVCASATPPVYVRADATYGPFPTGKDINLATGRQEIAAATSEADVAALTLDFEFENVSVKSVTSYLRDAGRSDTTGGEEWSSTSTIPPGPAGGQAGQSTTADPLHRGFPMFQAFYDATGGRGHSGSFRAQNARDGFEQELRISSAGGERLTWVAGAFFSDIDTHILYRYLTDPAIADLVMQLMYGPTFSSADRYGVVNDQGFQARLEADINDREYAAFGEANFWLVPERLRVTAGLRISKVELDYYQTNYGQFSGRLASSIGAVTEGRSSDTPVTPKFGVQYQFSAGKMAYLTAGKGFRAGGVNAQISQTICEPFLTPLGLTAADIPAAYEPDTVWSYELGGKFRMFDRLQLNVAAFRIDWEDIQATTTLGCGQGFASNGGRARSEGAELQVQYRPLDTLDFYVNAGYTDAYYIDPVVGPRGPSAPPNPTPSFNAGDKFDVPPFQLSTGTQYDFMLGSRLSSYVRVDYTYRSSYTAGATFGASGYGQNYFTRYKPSRDQLNLRAGVRLDNGLDVNAFVTNVLNREARIITPFAGLSDGRAQCAASSIDCSIHNSYSPFVTQTFQDPRQYGMQLNYRF